MNHSYQGYDLASGIPGLYWINLFSDELAAWLGLNGIFRGPCDIEAFSLRRAVA
jgi:hypothetical protein